MKNELITFDYAKTEIIQEESVFFNNELIKKFNNQKEDIEKFLKGYKNYFTETQETFQEFTFNEKSDIKNIEDKIQKIPAKKIFNDINNYNYAVGYLCLKHIKNSKEIYKYIDSFIDWANVALDKQNDKFLAKNENIDTIIENYCNCSKFNIDKYNALIDIATANASSEELKIVKKILQKAKQKDIDDKDKKIVFKKSKEESIEKFKKHYEKCLEAVQKIILHNKDNGLLSWYLESSTADLKDILEIGNEIEDEKKQSILQSVKNQVDYLLINILDYYIKCATVLNSKGVQLDDISSKFKINEILQTVGSYIKNDNIKLDILKLYMDKTPDQNSWAVLPLDLIENHLFSYRNDISESYKKNIISKLKERYSKTSNIEQSQIRDIINKVVTDSLNKISIKKYAFDEFENLFSENGIFLNDMLTGLIKSYQNVPEINEFIKKIFMKLIKNKVSFPSQIFNLLNDPKYDEILKCDIINIFLKNCINCNEKEIFLSQINIFNNDFNDLKESHFPFLNKCKAEFLNDNDIPILNRYALALSFIKEASAEKNNNEIQDCIDFVLNEKNYSLTKEFRTQLIDFITADKISQETRKFIIKKLLKKIFTKDNL